MALARLSARLVARLPLLSTMSISPLRGQAPYTLSAGSIQIAGQIQSPAGRRARTWTRPNVIDWREAMRALWMGGRMLLFPGALLLLLLLLLRATQLAADLLDAVQLPSASRSIVHPSTRAPGSGSASTVSVGRKKSRPSAT